MKIGRNERCFCGSGKKYKNCCLNKTSANSSSSSSASSETNKLFGEGFKDKREGKKEALIMTKTDEIYQPVRLHYKVFDKDKIGKELSKLKCIEFDDEKKELIWLYDYEAKNIKLNKRYSAIPMEYRPIIIGRLRFREESYLIVDVKSNERAVEAIEFFDKYISRDVAKVEYVDIVNRLFGGSEGVAESFDIYFDIEDIKLPMDPDELIERLKPLMSQTEDVKEREKIFNWYMKEQFNKPYSGAERLPVLFYEEGISSLKTSLRMRQIVATKHWFGDKNYTFYDLTIELATKVAEF